MNQGIILYGAPATGKDTVTAALVALDTRFRLFERYKAGRGRTAGYRMTTPAELDRLALAGEIVWENSRYGARYVIDRTHVRELVESGYIPVVHAGQPEVVAAVRDSIAGVQWSVVELQCSRETAAARISARATGDTTERLDAWDETPVLTSADLVIDTGQVEPPAAAQLILSLIQD